MSATSVDIVIPVFNGELSLPGLVERIVKTMDAQGMVYRVIMVDDGSKDQSWTVITGLKKTYGEKFCGIKLARNFGQHNALCCGFLHATSDLVITMDDDLQHPPEEIPKLLQNFNETNADVVYGMPESVKRGAIRKMGSNFVKRTSAYYKEGNRGGSAFRLIKKSIIDRIITNHSHNFVYIDAILNWYTANISHATVHFANREHGRSGYNVFKLTRLYFNLLINYSAAPLKWMIWTGFLSAFFSFLVGARFIYKKLVYDVPIGYTSIIVAILFGTGLILLSLGIIGQYIYKIYQLQYRKPAFYVQSIV